MIPITDNEYKQLTTYIQENYGIHLKDEKKVLLTGRLYGVLMQLGFSSFTEYYNYVVSDTKEEAAATLVNKITTNHTFFMREANHFAYFEEHVLPNFIHTVRDKDLRIWSAGCSTGQEPYTLAMIINTLIGNEKLWWDTKILATDISTQVLEEARKGIYSKDEVETLPAYWKMNYFRRVDQDKQSITDNIKNDVIFRKFNLMEETFPFKRKFHVIFCRNVMIYFDSIARKELINRFYEALDYGGYLFIGHSESINREEAKFKYILPAVYRKE